jgi:thioredoxin reductase
MAVDTPAKIAILGAGPIGLEAALYARFLGYDVVILEKGEVADHVRNWGHVRMFSTFKFNRSSLGLAALAAQYVRYHPPEDTALLTGRQWRDQYLLPLSQTDLLADHLRTQTSAVSVSKVGYLKQDLPGNEGREEVDFRVLIDAEGEPDELFADIVIDTTGVYSHHNWIGPGGAPAIGERDFRRSITYAIPDFLGEHRLRYAGKHVLLLGNGHSAATSIVMLDQLAVQDPSTRVTWITRRAPDRSGALFTTIADDRLPERAKLSTAANDCLAKSNFEHISGSWIRRVAQSGNGNGLLVEYGGTEPGQVDVDEIVANVGYRPDPSLYRELHVHQCYATEGPMKLAAKLVGNPSHDCLDQKPGGPDALINPEPHFYLLGAKSYGRNPNFLVTIGLEQIREVFSVIGDRPDLNLYEAAHPPLE